MAPRSIFVITGASACGKTAIVTALSGQATPGVRYHHFDAVGVPNPETMTARCRSPEGWQVAVCHQWITRLATAPTDRALDVLAGQGRPGTVQMTAWAAYLRGQADALHIPTLDTTDLSLTEAIERVRQHVTALAAAD